MSTTGLSGGHLVRMEDAERRVAATEVGRASLRVRWIKLVCMLALGVCFWYSVPYQLPIHHSDNPQEAAANEAEAYQGSRARQISMPVVALISVFMMWRLKKRGVLEGRVMQVGLMYCGWVAASYVWSTVPGTSGKRLVVFAFDAGFAVALAKTFSVTEMAALGFAATTTVAALAVYADVVMEKVFAPGDANYRFTGVMSANYQAMNLVVSMICAMTLMRRRPRWILWIAPVVVCELGLLYLTRSRLGTMICILMLAVLLMGMLRERLRQETRAIAMFCVLAVVVPSLIYVGFSDGQDAAMTAFMMGRNDSENTANLSNRAPLWTELWENVEKAPWVGVGYAAFWTPERVERVSQDQGWAVPNGHDSYLDQVLSVGFIGAFLYMGMLWGACAVAWRRNRRERTAESLFPAVMLTWLSLTSLAESAPLDPYLPTLLAYACIAKMAMAEGTDRASEAEMLPGSMLFAEAE